jgi:hypothetical protein
MTTSLDTQAIGLDVGPGGTILIADCFRAPGFKSGGKVRTVGGGQAPAHGRE